MPFSTYLDSQRENCRELVAELAKTFSYVSVLGSDVADMRYTANRMVTNVQEGMSERGFVVKLYSGKSFFEYSLDDLTGDKAELAKKICAAVQTAPELVEKMISGKALADEPMKEDFVRESDFEQYTDAKLLDYCIQTRDVILGKDEKIVNAVASLETFSVSKLFVTKNRELSQHYGWANGYLMVIYNDDGRMVMARDGANAHLMNTVLDEMPKKIDKMVHKAQCLSKATPVEPGVYDIITDPTITGLIAHEAFGHGVEMDQFVKDRALAKHSVGEFVASPITNMRDGANSTHSVASYFFDDDGVLAHDTQIIKNGVLVAGLSDLVSATELGTEPTGNGRRQSYKRKAYSRMTNTFFESGTDKLEDMIASVKHGYMLFECNNGMEDPKNWQIQCTAEYGIEIVDGKLTDHYVSPVVMSGSVPDLLKSITMISDDFSVEGQGMCGKGYKEWVRVSDGGPALKARVKLG